MAEFTATFQEEPAVEAAFDGVTEIKPTGTKEVEYTANGEYDEDVASYADLDVTVNVPNPSTGTLSITENGTHDVTEYAAAAVSVPQGVFPEGSLSITENGTYDVTEKASAVVNVDGYSLGAIISGMQPRGDVVVSGATRITQNALGTNTYITSFYSDTITTLSSNCFAAWSNVKKIELPNAVNGGNGNYCAWLSNLEEARFPKLKCSWENGNFNGCSKLKMVDYGMSTGIASNTFASCAKLQTLILRRSDAICALSNISAFNKTPMRGAGGLTGKVYVPSSLITAYQQGTNWATMFSAGTVEFVALEGSEYE